jgi:hypothetical protein
MLNVNVGRLSVSTLLGLTTTKLHISLLTIDVQDVTFFVSSWCWSLSFHCWQSRQKTYLLLLTVDVEVSAFIVDRQCRRPTFSSCWINFIIFYNNFTTYSQHIHKNIYNTSLHKFQYPFVTSLQIQTPVFQQWSERRTKAKSNSVLLNLFPSNASY